MILGFDSSHWQGPVDVTKMPADYKFAFVKATQDVDFIDPNYVANRASLLKSGRLVGSYHYLTGDDPVDQAQHFASVIGKPGKGELPPILDVEDAVFRTLGLAKTRNMVLAFLDEVDRLTGRKCGLYTGDAFFAWLGMSFKGRLVWVARYSPTAPEAPEDIWQYNAYGTLAGVGAGNVDLDRFNGSLTELRAWALIKTRNLKLGCSGADVKDAQRALNAHGATLVVDGKFGPATAAAVKKFKKANRLLWNSIIGKATRQKLGLG